MRETALDKKLERHQQARVTNHRRYPDISHLELELAFNKALSSLYKRLPVSSLEDLSNAVLAQAQAFTQSAQGFVAILHPATGNLISSQQVNWFSGDACVVSRDERGTVFARRPDGSYPGLWGNALNTHQGFYTNSPASSQVPLQRFLAVPVMLEDRPVGLLALADSLRNYTDRDVESVEQFSDVIAQAVQNERRTHQINDLASFAHNAAHDLKNPLGVMLSALDIIRDELPVGYPRLNQYIDIGMQGAERMNAIVDALLLFASVRDQDIPLTAVPVQECVTQALRDLSQLISRYQAEIITNCTWPTVRGYAPWIERVFVNYISNAIKYGGSPPVVELGMDPLPDGWIRLWVRDNGWGIPPEDRANLFKPFTRRSRHTDGYGLGLSIVQRIVEKLGGQVALESTVGRGSTFSFTLMVAQV